MTPRLIFTAAFAVLLAACAPQQTAPEAKTTDTPSQELKPLVMVTATPDPSREAARPRFDPQNPDWEIRYQELYERYAAKFIAPEVGQSVQVQLASGSQQSGVLKSISPTELTLEKPNGEITLAMTSLSPQSAANYFEAAYARNRALEQGRIEYQRWERMQAASRPKPTPTPPMSVRDIARGATPERTERPSSTDDGQDVPEYTSNITGIPRNEGPTGRVAQVDEYIRKNAAVPHSLRVQAWGPVQKNGTGYKVRVQYTLESADGFGTSHEDMMFFMNSSGRVYRKAAVK